MGVPILRSKTISPRLHPDSVTRQRLVDRLVSADAPVWLVSAPAGYGKTTVVAQAVEHLTARSDTTACWLLVDSADNDPTRFWTHLVCSVVDQQSARNEILDQLDSNQPDRIADSLLAFIEQTGNPTIIVVDDLHEIANIEILSGLGRVLRHLPANLKVAITSRTDPKLPLSRLRVEGQLVEIRADSLAFTPAEAKGIIGDLDSETVATLVDRTEGWATGLRMFSVAHDGGASWDEALSQTTGVGHDLGDYLAAEVLRSLPSGLRQFLVEASVLDELNPLLCDQTIGGAKGANRVGSLTKLRELARTQLFTTLVDSATETYRFHRLFRDYLRRQAGELPLERLVALHRAAASWYQTEDDPTATIRHALAADDDELALTTIRREYGPYAQAGLIRTIEGWLDSYGFDRCRADEELRIAAAWVALNTQKYASIDRWFDLDKSETPAPNFALHIQCVGSHRARHFGDLSEAVKRGHQAVELVTSTPGEHTDHSIAYAALSLAMQGANDSDLETSTLARDLGRTANNDSSIVTGYCGLAMHASQDPDQLDAAGRFADQALAFTTTPQLEWFHQPLGAFLAKSRVALMQGRAGDASTLAQRGEALAERASEPLMLTLIRCHLAMIEHAQGHSEEARAHLRSAEAVLGKAMPGQLRQVLRETSNRIRFVQTAAGLAVELSERELAVLRLLPHGLTRKELGAQLFVSENTIKSYLTSIRHKLGVTGQKAELIRRARQLGLLDSESTGDLSK